MKDGSTLGPTASAQRTMAFWVKGVGTVANQYWNFEPDNCSFLLQTTDGGFQWFSPSPNGLTVYGNGLQSGITAEINGGMDQWHHWAVVFNGSEVQVYTDGMEILVGSQPMNNSHSSLPFHIGVFEGHLGGDFIGSIDDFRVYDSLLTEEEVYDIYTTTSETSSCFYFWGIEICN